MEHDIVSPAYTGFYHVPLVWLFEEPTLEEWRTAPIDKILKVVLEGKIEPGIRYRVRSDGFIWFDFNKWQEGTFTVIPGYKVLPGKKIPQKTVEAKKLAEKRAYNRTMLLNAYQSCLNSSHATVRRRSAMLGTPIQSVHLVSLTDFSNPISKLYGSSNDPYCKFIDSSIEDLAKRNTMEVPSRRLIEKDVLEYSFVLLEKLLTNKNKDALKLTELLFWAHNQYSENSFSDSLILSWTVCEKLLNTLWKNFLTSKKEKLGKYERMNKDRIKKLGGRDFSSSVMSEILELSEIIPFELFKGLDKIRRKRNAWLHSLEDVGDRDATLALRVATEIFKITIGVKLTLGISRSVPGTGGVLLNMYSFPKEER